MDPRMEMIDSKFNRCVSLLRVQFLIKKLKDEEMHTSILKLISTTFNIIERLKDIDAKIKVINKADRWSLEQVNERELLQMIKDDLISEISGSVQTLEKSTHLLTTDSELLSVVDDLEKATNIFNRQMLINQLRRRGR